MFPKIGVAAIVKNNSWKVLISRRIGSHGKSSYGFPGGHLEAWESILECAAREVLEETGIIVKSSHILTFTEDIFSSEKHYITFFVLVEQYEWIPQVIEIEKNKAWEWYNWENLPEPLFLPIIHLKQKITNL